MDIHDINLKENKCYLSVDLREHKELLEGRLNYSDRDLLVLENVVDEIIKMSGVPSRLISVLKKQGSSIWVDSVLAMCEYYYGNVVHILVEDGIAVHASFKKVSPLLNTEFFKSMSSLLADYQDVYVDSVDYSKESYRSTITIYPTREFSYNDSNYKLGVMFINDELDTVTCRLVTQVGPLEFYVPVKYFNLSASRYLKTSKDRGEALSQLFLRVLESIMSDSWFSIIPEVDMNISHSKRISVTYEEYKQASRLFRHLAAESELDEEEVEDTLEELSQRFVDFEQNYPALDEKKGSYIWRCSALSENSIYDLIVCLMGWVNSSKYYPESVYKIKEYLGELVMLSRISTNLAKRKQ